MKWVIDDPARFLKEKAEMSRLEKESDWLTVVWGVVGGNIILDFDMTIHGRIFAARMTYPDMFPNTPPYIRPRDSSEHWSGHQYGVGGSLCLQWRADNWQISITGADMIRSAFALVETENHPEQPRQVLSEHQVTQGQAMRSSFRRFVCTHGLMDAWMLVPENSVTTFKATKIYSSSAIITFVTAVSDVDGIECKVSDLPEGIEEDIFSFVKDGSLFKGRLFDEASVIDSVDDLIEALTNSGLSASQCLVQEDGKYKERVIALMGTTAGSLRIFQIEAGELPKLVEIAVILPDPVKTRLPDNADQLAQFRVGIVGLGSAGSKIAISLARSGFRQFLLVDDDYLMPGNIVRHELSWTSVGAHKVEAITEELRLIAPNIQVVKKIMRIGGQESAMNAAATLKELASCNLLIDATANPQVFLLMAAVARQYKIPLCWGEIFAGGFGGLIARARPELDPNPLAVRDALYSYLATLPPAPYQDEVSYDVQHEQPLIAHDSDVGFIATSLTRLVLDTLTKQFNSDFPNSVYLIGMRKEWIFEAPFDVRPIDVQGEGWDYSLAEISDETRREAFSILLDLCEDIKNDNPDSST